MTRIIKIEDIQNGQIVAEPIYNKHRQIILNQGSELNISHIQILKTWNIGEIKIISYNEKKEKIPISEEISDEAQKNIESRCNWVPSNSWENDLIKVAKNYEIKNLLSKKD